MAIVLFARAAWAEDAPEPVGYRDAVEMAVREYGLGNYPESRALFARAHALMPNARTLRGLGMAEYELRNYGASVEQLEAALASQVRPLDADLRTQTQELLTRARGFVARLQVDTQPASSELRIDGELTVQRSLYLNLGEHALEVSAPAHLTESRTLLVRGGEELTQRFELLPAPVASATHDDRPRRWLRSPWLWTGVGLVVAGAVTAALLTTRPFGDDAPPYGGSSGRVGRAP